MFLGRSSSRFEFTDQYVRKFMNDPPSESFAEAKFMKEHPNVFIPILQIRDDSFDMPLWKSPKIPLDSSQALLSGLTRLELLWEKESGTSLLPQWRDALSVHLNKYVEAYSLQVNPNLVSFLVMSIPEPQKNVVIHGDPTLANILWDGFDYENWRWIDPLHRYYIPNDSAVDVGKMFQSCLGYEEVLLGQIPTFNFRLMEKISERSKVELRFGIRWAMIHIIRLLPYQRPADREIFEGILKDERLRKLYL